MLLSKTKRASHLNVKKWLNDDIMDAAQLLLSRKFSNVHQSVLYCRKPENFQPVQGEHLQLTHDGKGHWVLVFCSRDRVQVCDSLRKRLNAGMKRCTKAPFSFALQPDGSMPVSWLTVAKQSDFDSCGLYAIAYAADIIAGISPVTPKYDESAMRPHLTQCLQTMQLETFPKIETRKRQPIADSLQVVII